MYTTLEVLRDGPIATVWLNRPEVHNAFNVTLIADLKAACRQLEAEDAVRVVVLAGRGKSFCAGADLSWMKAAGEASIEENTTDARRLASMLQTLAELRKPTIARVHGSALGGGLGLAAACDLCVAATHAVFAASEVRLGIIAATISPYVVRAIGERQAHRYLLTAERISAAQAHAIGLAHEVVAPEQLDAKIAELIYALLQGGPKALAASKALIRAVANHPVDEKLVHETARQIAELRATPEGQEGLAAFLEKRPPAWLTGAASQR